MKKAHVLFLILSVLFIIGSIILIPLNLYVLKLPEYSTVIAAVLTVLSIFAYCFKKPGKSALKIILPVTGLFAVVITLFGSYCNPYWNSNNMNMQNISPSADASQTISSDMARKDLDFMMKYLKKNHPAFLHGMPDTVRNAYESALKDLKQTDTVTVNTLRQKAQGILSLLEDAHTSVQGNYSNTHYLKTVAARQAENWNLVKVNGTSIETLFENNRQLFSYEVDTWGINRMRAQLLTLEGLGYLGFDMATPIAYTYRNNVGAEETELYTANDFVTYKEYAALNKSYLQEKQNQSFVSYTIDEEKSLAVLTLNSCTYNDAYRTCVKNMFAQIKEKQIQNIAVDLRENGGGNSLVINYFLSFLDVERYYTPTSKWRLGPFLISAGNGTVKNKKNTELLFHGNLYLLTSHGTFSSAMMFAQCVKDNELGTIIGEAPGNTPSGYGDIAAFSLPNSKLYFQVSTKKFYRANPNTSAHLVEPDVRCDKNSVLETLYDII